IVAELSGPYTLGVTITTRWILSALCSAVISSGSAISGVYVRPANHGTLAGSPWICVWQSHAPAGTAKLTLVAGWCVGVAEARLYQHAGSSCAEHEFATPNHNNLPC